MHLYRHFADYPQGEPGLALAIGNFDGFHRGHQAVIAKMKQEADRGSLKSAVMIFEPQPLEFFGRSVPPRLYTLRSKLKAFKQAEIDTVFCVSFTKDFASLSAEQFVDLLRSLNVRCVVVGSPFSFGRQGRADFNDLKRLCSQAGISAFAIEQVALSGQRISSTKIREYLQQGALHAAAECLGRPFSMSGRVVRGRQLGRTLGFPTANVNLNRKVSPLDGVYTVSVQTPQGLFAGVANVGNRPTVSGGRSLLEVFIFDFDDDLYGREIEVFFLSQIRREIKFASLEDLKTQLQRDAQSARMTAIFARQQGLNSVAACCDAEDTFSLSLPSSFELPSVDSKKR